MRYCEKCGHNWEQRFAGLPKICPKCKTKRWHKGNEIAYIATVNCLKCGHEWFPRTPERPIVCPKCMDPRWWKPRKIKKEVA
jgi:predicted Zn-ribbon and HTH transcriptional regulator